MPVSHVRPRAGRTRHDPDHLKVLPTAAGGLPETLVARLDGHLARFAEHMREGLLAASVAVGLDVMAELMAAEVAEVAGPRGKHQRSRGATRHGSEGGTVTLGGRRLPISRPRVRSADGCAEVPLASYAAFRGGDLLAGLSARRYAAGSSPWARASMRGRPAPAARRSRAASWPPPRRA